MAEFFKGGNSPLQVSGCDHKKAYIIPTLGNASTAFPLPFITISTDGVLITAFPLYPLVHLINVSVRDVIVHYIVSI